MTYEEAIKILSAKTTKGAVEELKSKANYDRSKVLYDIQTAMNIGAKALEKQMPKEPLLIITDDNELVCEICPTCQKVALDSYRMKCCPNCGQVIDWRGGGADDVV